MTVNTIEFAKNLRDQTEIQGKASLINTLAEELHSSVKEGKGEESIKNVKSKVGRILREVRKFTKFQNKVMKKTKTILNREEK